MRARLHRAWALAALLFGLASGCQPAQVRYEQEVEETPPAARHAIHDERLRELMSGLATLHDERLPQAMDVRTDEARRRAELARVARALERSAARIPELVPEDALDAGSREELRRYARTLASQARQLGEDAPRLDVGEAEARLHAIEATCAGCHARFRSGAGAR